MATTETMAETTKASSGPECEDLFRKYSPLVYRTACLVTGSPDDAQDVLQTIFLRLLRRSVPPNFYKYPERYLYRAAVNVSLNVVRSKRRHVLIADLAFFERAEGADRPNLDEAALERIRNAVAKLSARTVEVLVLRYVHDRTEPEIAKLLGISRGTVSVLLFRSRIRLRKLLRRSSPGEGK
jgi:RNA polymerase sigma-70 factor, ECF subfamily